MSQALYFSILRVLYRHHPLAITRCSLALELRPRSLQDVAISVEELIDSELLTSANITHLRLTEKGFEFAQKIAGKGVEQAAPAREEHASTLGAHLTACAPVISPEQLADVLDEESTNRRGRFLELYAQQLAHDIDSTLDRLDIFVSAAFEKSGFRQPRHLSLVEAK